MDASNRRIVLLGKTGVGKSSLANTLIGEDLFKISHTPRSETNKCKAETRSVNGRSITVIDTPGFFDTNKSADDLRAEIVRCIVECAPGPHAFLLLLKVEKYTSQEQAVINEMVKPFSEEVFNYVTVVFTHGDQLEEEQEIEDFIREDEKLSDLVRKKCGGRCHVIDNKYWKDKSEKEYRSNQCQGKKILETIDKMVKDNKAGCYTNEMLQVVEEEIQKDMKDIRESSVSMPEEEIREKAKKSTTEKLLIRLAGVATGVLIGALFGAGAGVVAVLKVLQFNPAVVGSLAGLGAVAGGVAGGFIGYKIAEEADSPLEAVKMVAEAAKDKAMTALTKPKQHLDTQSHPKYEQFQNKD